MKKILGIVLCIGALLPTRIQAEEETSTIKTVISFNLTAEDRFTYEVTVSKGGSLYDGNQRITNGVIEYQLSVGERKKFRISPDNGYEIKEIKNNGERQNTDIEGLEIVGVSANSALEVRYGRIESSLDITDPPEVPEQPNEPNDSNGQGSTGQIEKEENGVNSLIPITGDMFGISEYVCLILIVLYRLFASRRGINTYIRVNDIAISEDIEAKQKTLKEEKKDEK